jgi:cell division septal protein FtsQ
MTRRRAMVIGAGGLAAAVCMAWLVPLGLRQVEFFRVRQVEIVGLRYLPPAEVLARIELERERSLFDPLGALEHRVAAVPGIVDFDIDRRLPGSLRITVREEAPIAFARGRDGLVPIDLEAHPLPYDPAETGFDLPIVERPDVEVTRLLGIVRRVDPDLYRQIDGARRGGGESVILELGDKRLLLRAAAGEEDIREVETVRLHLDRNAVAYRELDARFEGWVVVRRERA